MATPSRSLADDIRGRSDAELIDLVLARPDLARPAPADLTSLAARAGTRASVQRAVEALDRGHLQVLATVGAARARRPGPHPGHHRRGPRRLARHARTDDVGACLRRPAGRAGRTHDSALA